MLPVSVILTRHFSTSIFQFIFTHSIEKKNQKNATIQSSKLKFTFAMTPSSCIVYCGPCPAHFTFKLHLRQKTKNTKSKDYGKNEPRTRFGPRLVYTTYVYVFNKERAHRTRTHTHHIAYGGYIRMNVSMTRYEILSPSILYVRRRYHHSNTTIRCCLYQQKNCC